MARRNRVGLEQEIPWLSGGKAHDSMKISDPGKAYLTTSVASKPPELSPGNGGGINEKD
jgi:hypothetical protein